VVLVRLDFPKNHPQSTRVKEQNTALKNRYPFDGYPTIVILDSSGRELGRQSGYNPGSGPNAYLAALEGTMRR
jgi:thioredoxin-related protein